MKILDLREVQVLSVFEVCIFSLFLCGIIIQSQLGKLVGDTEMSICPAGTQPLGYVS